LLIAGVTATCLTLSSYLTVIWVVNLDIINF
jgi:hypothetical protein